MYFEAVDAEYSNPGKPLSTSDEKAGILKPLTGYFF
jgi:hypothetical protein